MELKLLDNKTSKFLTDNPSANKTADGFFSVQNRPIQRVEISHDLREWYRDECAKERIEILSQGFSQYDLDSILRDMESDGLFALALAGNILRSIRRTKVNEN